MNKYPEDRVIPVKMSRKIFSYNIGKIGVGKKIHLHVNEHRALCDTKHNAYTIWKNVKIFHLISCRHCIKKAQELGLVKS